MRIYSVRPSQGRLCILTAQLSIYIYIYLYVVNENEVVQINVRVSRRVVVVCIYLFSLFLLYCHLYFYNDCAVSWSWRRRQTWQCIRSHYFTSYSPYFTFFLSLRYPRQKNAWCNSALYTSKIVLCLFIFLCWVKNVLR
jgi:hypothetical protein